MSGIECATLNTTYGFEASQNPLSLFKNCPSPIILDYSIYLWFTLYLNFDVVLRFLQRFHPFTLPLLHLLLNSIFVYFFNHCPFKALLWSFKWIQRSIILLCLALLFVFMELHLHEYIYYAILWYTQFISQCIKSHINALRIEFYVYKYINKLLHIEILSLWPDLLLNVLC